MSYQLSYDNLENYIKQYMLILIIKNKGPFTLLKISIVSKLLSSICRYKFDTNLLYKLFVSPNESTGYINPKFINLKTRFLNSIKLLLINETFGCYLLKYYYIIFCTFYTYHKSIKFICIKVHNKSKLSPNEKLYRLILNSQVNNMTDLNIIISKLNLKTNFSLNDDNNYNIINNIAKMYIELLEKSHFLNLKEHIVIVDEENIVLSFLKNINSLKDNIQYLK